ncbi:MAG: hypothetical protein AB7G93_05085 [Bdellovibrionales bacterium]
MRIWVKLLGVSLAFASAAAGEEPGANGATDKNKGSCDFEVLTENCSIFSPTGSYKIELPDKETYLLNTPALAEAAAAAGSQAEAVAKQVAESMIERQLEVATILDRIPSSTLSVKLKLMFTNSPAVLGLLQRRIQLWPNARLSQEKSTIGELTESGLFALSPAIPNASASIPIRRWAKRFPIGWLQRLSGPCLEAKN